MTRRLSRSLSLAVFALTSLALVAAVPTAAAEAGSIKCNPEPLGPPGQGVVGYVKTFANAEIYGACVLASDIADYICVFVTGRPCPVA